MRIIFRAYFIGFIFLIQGCSSHFTFEKSKILNDYPSGSGITYFNNSIYLIGDDSGKLLMMDTAFNITDSVQLIESQQQRISKELKPDLEAATMVTVNNSTEILLVGSGSLAPHRNTGWLINPVNKQKTLLALNQFYNRLKADGIEALNIEGVTAIPGGIVLSSRGNKTLRGNYLIFTSNAFWKNQESAAVKIIKVGSNNDTAFFNGVSGLEYSKLSDRLLLTVSTENTYNTFD